MSEASKPTSVRFFCPVCRDEVTQQVSRKMAGAPDRVVGVCASGHYAYYSGKPTSGPLVVYRAVGLLLRLGLAFWFRVLGKRARASLITGFVLSTIAALILEEKL